MGFNSGFKGLNKNSLLLVLKGLKFVAHCIFVISMMLTTNSECPAERYLTGLSYGEAPCLLSYKKILKYYADKVYSYASVY